MSILRRAYYKALRIYSRVRSNPLWARPLDNLAVRLFPGKLAVDLYGITRLDDATALGPLQRPEALMLFAAAMSTRPRVVVEFGFYRGDSTVTLLRAVPSTTKVYSIDIDKAAVSRAKQLERRFMNFSFLLKSQADFSADDVGRQQIDFAFLDAAHDFDMNCETWRRLDPCLAQDAVVFIHDTGVWHRERMLEPHKQFLQSQPGGKWVEQNCYAHQLDERRFVNWLLETYPKYAAVHLHSTRVLRHGMTIVQKQSPLAV